MDVRPARVGAENRVRTLEHVTRVRGRIRFRNCGVGCIVGAPGTCSARPAGGGGIATWGEESGSAACVGAEQRKLLRFQSPVPRIAALAAPVRFPGGLRRRGLRDLVAENARRGAEEVVIGEEILVEPFGGDAAKCLRVDRGRSGRIAPDCAPDI